MRDAVPFELPNSVTNKGIFGAIANVARVAARFDESKHRRVSSGPTGGQFTSGGGGGGGGRSAKPAKPHVRRFGSQLPRVLRAQGAANRPPTPGSGKPPANLGNPKTAQEAVDHMVWLLGRAGTIRRMGREGHPLSEAHHRELLASIHMAQRLRQGHFTLAAEAGGKPKEGTTASKEPKKPAGPPKSLHEQIASHPGAQKFGLTLQVLGNMHPDAVASVAASLGIKTEKGLFRLPSFVIKATWQESKHPRGQPKNRGQFGRGGGGSSSQKKTPRLTPEQIGEVVARVAQSKIRTQQRQSKEPTSTAPTGKLSEIARIMVGEIKESKQRAFTGEPTGGKISKQLAGAIGEEIIIKHLHSLGYEDAGHLSGFVGTEKNNLPVDLIHDHRVIEVKTGQSSNGAGAQQWRLTIGEPGEKEKALLKKMSPEAKAKFNAKKQAEIHKRKKLEIAKLERELGYSVKGKTMTVIINPDTKTADLYEFDGFHDRIGWTSEQAKSGYVKSVRYG